MENKESKVYELGYSILPSIPEDKVPAVVDKIRGIISKSGGKEIDGEEPFKTDLAYTMAKTIGASRYVVNDAYIGWVKFEMDGENAISLKKAVDETEEILRSLLIKAPRETAFTFAKAKAAKDQKEREEKGEGNGEEAPAGEPAEVVE